MTVRAIDYGKGVCHDYELWHKPHPLLGSAQLMQSACVLADQNEKGRQDAYSSCILEDPRGELYTWSY